ncbi:MAG: GTP-binding protein [candidate division KSB1 bacterium]|nr:GTP-binding protein [candidate division KSB1 bacterium]MDZ7300871.1 GTP-binding protein [candidate division KSB1 bacterium]MDZ7309859.1 GTP-binding protein [candidate division KSB1 bacterium]
MSKKICLLGMFAVGKTSLVRRFVENVFDEKYLSTIGVKVSRKQIAISGHKTHTHVDLLLWDIASQDYLQQTALNYFRGAHGALVVHDLTRPESAQRLALYCERFLQVAPGAKLVFAGNKSDLVKVENFNLAQFQEQMGALAGPHLLTSAKTGENVEKVFQLLAEAIIGQDG